MDIYGDYSQGGYYVDIVMCIDGTGSMSPIIDKVKNDALAFHSNLSKAMVEAGKYIGQLRVKVIVFRDYMCDTDAMVESPFYVLPNDASAFKSFVSSITACGGGDTPENGLEAISYALKSDWTLEGLKRRHVTVIFTDAPAHALGERADCARYPKDLPKSFSELADVWEGVSQSYISDFDRQSKRLIAFVPAVAPWSELETWSNCWVKSSDKGKGGDDISMQDVYDSLVRSFDAPSDDDY